MSAAAAAPRGDGYWPLYAARIHAAGYQPVPIAPGTKACYVRGWRELDFTGTEPLADHGVGIKAGAVVGLDIDSLDAHEVEHIEALAAEHLGANAPRRVGNAPKALLVYRTDSPRKKITHKLPSGGKVEVLGVGQQFVAFATHPDTKAPYTWTSFKPFKQLPLVTAEQIDAFLTALREALPSPVKPSSAVSGGRELQVFDTLTLEQLHAELRDGAGPADYDAWRDATCALRTRLECLKVDSATHRDMWHAWSERSAGHKDCKMCAKVWNGWNRDEAPIANEATPDEFPTVTASDSAAVAEQSTEQLANEKPIIPYHMNAASIDAYNPTLKALLANAERWGVLGFGRMLRQPWEAERDGFKGRKVKALELQPLSGAALRNVLSTHIRFDRLLNSGERKTTDAPSEICAELASRPQDWHAIEVDRVALTPIFRDGKLIATKGHSREARVYIDAPAVELDSDLSRTGAERNLATLSDWIGEFPFDSELDRSAALCALFTAAFRASLPSAPGIIVDKPNFGSGGSTLCDLIHVVLTGKPAAVVSMAHGRDANEELRKHIDACQLGGYPALAVDNLPEGSTLTRLPALAQLLTQLERDVRVLGESRTVRIACSQLVLLNGNNASVGEDFVRRFIRTRLDPRIEHPELRTFKRPELIHDAIAARAAILSAIYSITAAYRTSGTASDVHLAGFEPWAQMCVAPLVWLGLPNPITTQQALAANDESRSVHREVMQVIAEMHGDGWWRAGELVAAAAPGVEPGARLYELLYASELLDAKRFGKWLHGLHGRLAGGLQIDRDPASRAYVRWRIRGAPSRSGVDASFADLLGIAP